MKKLLARRGYIAISGSQSDIEPEFLSVYLQCKPATMTSLERMYGLYKAVEYVVQARIPGDIVECGVWRGGSSMLSALTLERQGDKARDLYLYDTFAGMTRPTERDVDVSGRRADTKWLQSQRGDHNAWAYASLEEVQRNMNTTGLSSDRVHFVKGPVEDTIPETVPARIAILRLDTDFYESTRHELRHLFPLLSPGGVLLVDDYGHWAGSRQAVDEYFAEHPPRILLNRLDSDGRIGVRLPTS